MGLIKDSNIMGVVTQPEVDGEEDALDDGWDAIPK